MAKQCAVATWLMACLAVSAVYATAECTTILETATAAGLTFLANALQNSEWASFAADPAVVFTVLAPTNEAFSAQDARDLLKSASDADLNTILGTHILPYSAVAAVLTNVRNDSSGNLSSINGQRMSVTETGDVYTITDPTGRAATILTPDIAACGSILHVIDTVLTAAARSLESSQAADKADASAGREGMDSVTESSLTVAAGIGTKPAEAPPAAAEVAVKGTSEDTGDSPSSMAEGGSEAGDEGASAVQKAAALEQGRKGCVRRYAQCGGIGHEGATCCQGNSACEVTNAFYSSCRPGPPLEGIVPFYKRCSLATGALPCEEGSACKQKTEFFAQCVPDT